MGKIISSLFECVETKNFMFKFILKWRTGTWVRIVEANSSLASSILVFLGPPHMRWRLTLLPIYFSAWKETKSAKRQVIKMQHLKFSFKNIFTGITILLYLNLMAALHFKVCYEELSYKEWKA